MRILTITQIHLPSNEIFKLLAPGNTQYLDNNLFCSLTPTHSSAARIRFALLFWLLKIIIQSQWWLEPALQSGASQSSVINNYTKIIIWSYLVELIGKHRLRTQI